MISLSLSPTCTRRTQLAEDVDVDVSRWLRAGTPTGIETPMTPRGVSPMIDEATPLGLRRPLDVFHDGSMNYASLDEDPEGIKALHDLVDNGFVKQFDTYDAAVAYLSGREPVSSKLAVVKNVSDGVVKYRLILDCRVSGASDAAERRERNLLPKAWGIIRGIMALRKACCEGESVYLFVLEFKDAFYMLPLLSDERRYFTAYHQGWGMCGSGWLRGR